MKHIRLFENFTSDIMQQGGKYTAISVYRRGSSALYVGTFDEAHLEPMLSELLQIEASIPYDAENHITVEEAPIPDEADIIIYLTEQGGLEAISEQDYLSIDKMGNSQPVSSDITSYRTPYMMSSKGYLPFKVERGLNAFVCLRQTGGVSIAYPQYVINRAKKGSL